MRETKLIFSIFALIISAYTLIASIFYSIIDLVQNTYSEYIDEAVGVASGGTAGKIFGIIMLISGVIGCVVRDSKIVAILNGTLYLFAAIIAFIFHSSFNELIYFGIIALVFSIFYFLSCIGWKSSNASNSETQVSKNKLNQYNYKENTNNFNPFTTNYQNDFYKPESDASFDIVENLASLNNEEDLRKFKDLGIFKNYNPKKRTDGIQTATIYLDNNRIINIDKDIFTLVENNNQSSFNLNNLKRYGLVKTNSLNERLRIEYFNELDPYSVYYINIDFNEEDKPLISEIGEYLKTYIKK